MLRLSPVTGSFLLLLLTIVERTGTASWQGLTRKHRPSSDFPVDPAAPFRVDPASDGGATPMAGPLIDTTLDMRTNAPDRQEESR